MKKLLRILTAVCVLLALFCAVQALADGETFILSPKTANIPELDPNMKPPSNLKVKKDGPLFKLTWDPVYRTLCDGYVLYQCKCVDQKPASTPFGWYTKKGGKYWYPYKVVTIMKGHRNTQCELEAYKTGTYYYELRCYFGSAYRRVSGKATFAKIKITSIVTSPKNVKAKQETKSSVKLTWKASLNAKSYEIYRKVGKQPYVRIGSTKKCYFTDKDIKIGNYYKYKIMAKNGSSENWSSEIYAKPMDKPTSFKAAYKNGKVTLQWKKVKYASQYRVYEKYTYDSKFTQVALTTETSVTVYPDHLGKYSYYVVPAYGSFDGLDSKSVSIKAESHYRALIVANDYLNTSSLGNLPGSPNNAKALKGMLNRLSQGWIVTTVQNANADEILSAISSTFNGSTSEDVCLFYYSGHGSTGRGEYSGALCGNDGKSHVTTAQLANALNSACGGKVIVLLDSCGSGAGIDPDYPSQSDFLDAVMRDFSARNKSITNKYGELIGEKFIVIAAAATGTVSYESSAFGSWRSVFAYALLHAAGASFPDGSLSGSMPGDTNKDGKLTLGEAFFNMREFIQEIWRDNWTEGSQQTRISGNWEFVLFER